MRDTQRSRVYRAEQGWCTAIGDKLFPDRVAFLGFIEKIERDAWFRRTYGRRTFRVHDGRGRASAAAWGTNNLTFPRHSRRPTTVLHEIAHCVSGSTHDGMAGHGWQYCQAMLALVRHFLGADAHRILRAHYKASRVRCTKPRRGRDLSEEQRAELRARLAKLRKPRDLAASPAYDVALAIANLA